MAESVMRLRVNGREHHLVVSDEATLLEVLREQLHLHGTKDGCAVGSCGTCTVWLDGVPRLSCVTLAKTVEGRDVVTIEGLAGWWGRERPGEGAAAFHPLQTAAVEAGAVQCGFCTPGMLMAGAALLRDTPAPGREEIREALSGHLCRCTGYEQIIHAVELAAGRMGEATPDEA